jgi:hypothetical protein
VVRGRVLNKGAYCSQQIMDGGVEFGPVPAELATTFNTLTQAFGPVATLAPDEFGISS